MMFGKNRRRATATATNFPSEELIDKIVEEPATRIISDDSSCIVVTHKVDNTDDLISFVKGYVSSSIQQLPPKPSTDDDFREFLAGFCAQQHERIAGA